MVADTRAAEYYRKNLLRIYQAGVDFGATEELLAETGKYGIKHLYLALNDDAELRVRVRPEALASDGFLESAFSYAARSVDEWQRTRRHVEEMVLTQPLVPWAPERRGDFLEDSRVQLRALARHAYTFVLSHILDVSSEEGSERRSAATHKDRGEAAPAAQDAHATLRIAGRGQGWGGTKSRRAHMADAAETCFRRRLMRRVLAAWLLPSAPAERWSTLARSSLLNVTWLWTVRAAGAAPQIKVVNTFIEVVVPDLTLHNQRLEDRGFLLQKSRGNSRPEVEVDALARRQGHKLRVFVYGRGWLAG
jgi:hypothetical protein